MRVYYGPMHCAAVIVAVFALPISQFGVAQQATPEQQRIQSLQQIFSNRMKKPHQYEWIETTTVTLDGQSRRAKQSMCRYAADGKIQRTPLGAGDAGFEERGQGVSLRGGLIRRARMAKKKRTAQESLEQVRALTQMYLPLDRGKMKEALTAGQVSVDRTSSNQMAVVISNYAKKGDELKLIVDLSIGQLRAVSIKTYFDKPKNTLTASMEFTTLADGAEYPSFTTVDAPSKKLSISTTSSDFAKPVNH
jgi:hypothetical protein